MADPALRPAPTADCIAVVVTYNSAADVLAATVTSLRGQVGGFVIIDNSAPDTARRIKGWLDHALAPAPFVFCANGRNIGIAAAQNIGVALAVKMGAQHILFSDHDTVFPAGCVQTLLAALHRAQSHGDRIAAIAPAYVNILDPERPEPFFIRHEGHRQRRIHPGTETIRVGHVISSGMIAPVAAFGVVGPFNEGLFIDWVDIEWCLRAVAKGYGILGCGSICLRHRLGDTVIRYRDRSVVIHSPARHYYMVRNAVFLARSPHVADLLVRLRILYSGLRYALFFPLVGRPRRQHALACLRGLWHGLSRRPPV